MSNKSHKPARLFQALAQVRGRDIPPAQVVGQALYMPQQMSDHAGTKAALAEPFGDTMSRLGFVTLEEQANRLN